MKLSDRMKVEMQVKRQLPVCLVKFRPVQVSPREVTRPDAHLGATEEV